MKKLRHQLAVGCLWLAHKIDPEFINSLLPVAKPEETEPIVETPVEGGESSGS